MLAKEKINELKQSVNIVDIIGESVALTKAGRNYLGLCPFHGEKTPSFNVVEDKQFYHCFAAVFLGGQCRGNPQKRRSRA